MKVKRRKKKLPVLLSLPLLLLPRPPCPPGRRRKRSRRRPGAARPRRPRRAGRGPVISIFRFFVVVGVGSFDSVRQASEKREREKKKSLSPLDSRPLSSPNSKTKKRTPACPSEGQAPTARASSGETAGAWKATTSPTATDAAEGLGSTRTSRPSIGGSGGELLEAVVAAVVAAAAAAAAVEAAAAAFLRAGGAATAAAALRAGAIALPAWYTTRVSLGTVIAATPALMASLKVLPASAARVETAMAST